MHDDQNAALRADRNIATSLFHEEHSSLQRCSVQGTRTRVSVGHLPTELLLMVFNQVFLLSVDKGGRWKPEKDLLASHVFPYSLAAVCLMWRDILATVPAFWTRLVVAVDANPTPLENIQSYLTQSADLPLYIVVSRRDNFAGPDLLEGPRVAAVMHLLGRHIERWRTLHVNVIHTSSLPSPVTDIHGCAGQLEDLSLDAKAGDRLEDERRPFSTGTIFFKCPSLNRLRLDAQTFRDIVMFHAGLPRSLRLLTIAHYSPGNPSLYLDDLLRLVPNVTYLCLIDLELSVMGLHLPFLQLPQLTGITFEDMSAAVLKEIFGVHQSFEHMAIIHCSLKNITRVPSSSALSLVNIDEQEDIWPILSGWSSPGGGVLSIDGCPSFDDETLQKMTLKDESGNRLCPGISTLFIYHSKRVSGRLVRELVEARRMDNVSIGYLQVFDCGEISQEDREWLKANVHGFSWE